MPIPPPPNLPRRRRGERLEEVPASNAERNHVVAAYGTLPALVPMAMADTPHDWITLECLANDVLYAKPDTQKRFVLWEANLLRLNPRPVVTWATGARVSHPWLATIFQPNMHTIRLPFNTGDSSERSSLSWISARNMRLQGGQFFELPRWSTASRSSVALIPNALNRLQAVGAWPDADRRCEMVMRGANKVNVSEWRALEAARAAPMASARFSRLVPNLGAAVAPGGVTPPGWNGQWRLYSIKTGVNYVGTKFEGPGVGNKHLLEANSTMAMLRSDLAAALPNNDATFGMQGELLTITAPMDNGTRDGFQVRDLSCLQPGRSYIPGQAIPYARRFLDLAADHGDQMDYWRANFAVPLGRAKARLFLNYGLIHTSANAQNFVLGYVRRGQARIEQFVARDLGDTSWHDDYIRQYLTQFTHGRQVFQALQRELRGTSQHILHRTSSGQYPAPHMVRLASNSVLTHGFSDTLGWRPYLCYQFATGLFDGFTAFVNEAIGVDMDPATHAQQAVPDQTVMNLGYDGRYTHPTGSHAAYRQRVNEVLRQPIATLLAKARWVRNRAIALSTRREGDRVERILNAEEILICGALEKHLGEAGQTERNRIRQRLQTCFAGNWPAVIT
ncbi:hypothetical protein [Haliangium ochraceum]|uniref:Corrinoid adenosyltransferase BtuR/CobO/CobP n=1 Tax=Haliangium ochraceum (strain DSM 14365 / JCM 11303 / SMP-2) TaxID=502025 RepID=D0LMM0_HALO1|nr:hypothetical protein [Haliangium ochraceum]ACY18707.1 corrinoid adenosyltransferase BtuR/CobO/CobP [Haliangium ochraceum DSM 14365]